MRSGILMKLSIRMNTSARLRLAYGIAAVLRIISAFRRTDIVQIQ